VLLDVPEDMSARFLTIRYGLHGVLAEAERFVPLVFVVSVFGRNPVEVSVGQSALSPISWDGSEGASSRKHHSTVSQAFGGSRSTAENAIKPSRRHLEAQGNSFDHCDRLK
jgi:hypothetical protein